MTRKRCRGQSIGLQLRRGFSFKILLTGSARLREVTSTMDEELGSVGALVLSPHRQLPKNVPTHLWDWEVYKKCWQIFFLSYLYIIWATVTTQCCFILKSHYNPLWHFISCSFETVSIMWLLQRLFSAAVLWCLSVFGNILLLYLSLDQGAKQEEGEGWARQST